MFLTLALHGSECQHYAPAAVTLGKNYTLNKILGGHQRQSGQFGEKITLLLSQDSNLWTLY